MNWLNELYTSQKRESKKDLERSLVDAIFRVYDRFPRIGLRERIGQQEMSLDIADAYIHGRNAMIEAGVGIGKSFGYLIPSLLTNQMSHQPVIIATSSIQLSEQIHKDLRVIGSRLGFTTVRSVVGKGMAQYACRSRAAELFRPDDPNSSLSTLAQRVLAYEIDERADIKGGIRDAEWSNVSVNDCQYERCHHKNGCLFYDMRAKLNAKAHEIDFIIVNQDLLIRDLMKKKKETEASSRNSLLSSSLMKHIIWKQKFEMPERSSSLIGASAALSIPLCSFSRSSPGIKVSFHNPSS
ncbi:DEAD/DEAH box helicase [Paenibacillus sp. 1A_MP2]|uniref:DEAD/DEAH box helicase n=1 Tax=Paenibacillus sp. 1A_MP2 TaxID=3457495 RepID=UPI003FCED1DF